MSHPLSAISDPDARRIVAQACQHGWEYTGLTGTNHHAIVHIATGTRLTFSSSPTVASWKSLATDIERVSGRGTVWTKGNRRRSRKNVEHTAFLDAHTPYKQRKWSDDLAQARDDYVGIWERMRATDHLSKPMRDKLLHLEAFLRTNHQPCPIEGARWFTEYFDD